jgi:hypothetical protein
VMFYVAAAEFVKSIRQAARPIESRRRTMRACSR